MFIKKVGNGDWYVYRKTSANSVGRRSKNQVYRDWFWIKQNRMINLKHLTFPKEFIGKKIRLKIEVILNGR